MAAAEQLEGDGDDAFCRPDGARQSRVAAGEGDDGAARRRDTAGRGERVRERRSVAAAFAAAATAAAAFGATLDMLWERAEEGPRRPIRLDARGGEQHRGVGSEQRGEERAVPLEPAEGNQWWGGKRKGEDESEAGDEAEE